MFLWVPRFPSWLLMRFSRGRGRGFTSVQSQTQFLCLSSSDPIHQVQFTMKTWHLSPFLSLPQPFFNHQLFMLTSKGMYVCVCVCVWERDREHMHTAFLGMSSAVHQELSVSRDLNCTAKELCWILAKLQSTSSLFDHTKSPRSMLACWEF